MNAPSASILVVDDRPENLKAIVAVLELLGCRIVSANSGREALRLLLNEEFAAILLDVQMPEMDGFETASYIRDRQKTKAIPIIFMSAVSTSAEHVFRGYEAGAVDYIVKPIDPVVLRSKVAVFAELYERGEEIARQAEILRERDRERALQEAAERRHRRSRFLEAATSALDRRADVRGRVEQLGRSCVPQLADFALVELLEEDDRPLLLAVAHRDAAVEQATRELLRTLRGAGLLGRGGRAPAARIEPSASRVAWKEAFPELVGERLWGQLEPASVISVPLLLRGRLLGSLALGRTDGSPPYGEDELELARELAKRAAIALENSRLYEAERERSRTLQLSLLGDTFLENPGVTAATRYLPGSAELEVGGDWYDLVEREDGRIFVIVGDVVGRGIRAATAMGKLRSAIGALALVTESPAELLVRLDNYAARIEEAHLATVACALLDPRDGLLRYSSAGHLPPLVVGPEGQSALLEDGRGFPLGVGDATLERDEAQAVLVPGSTLIVFTDGLVESRDVAIETGLERLVRAAVERRADEPERICDELVQELVDGPGDDVALVCLRLEPPPADLLVRRFPALPSEVGIARRQLAEWLAARGVSRDEVGDVVLAFSEACANAVQHAYPEGSGDVMLDLRLRHDGNLVLRVRDTGRWHEPGARPDRGRGLDIIRALVDDAHVHGTPQGTTVSMRKRVLTTDRASEAAEAIQA